MGVDSGGWGPGVGRQVIIYLVFEGIFVLFLFG